MPPTGMFLTLVQRYQHLEARTIPGLPLPGIGGIGWEQQQQQRPRQQQQPPTELTVGSLIQTRLETSREHIKHALAAGLENTNHMRTDRDLWILRELLP